MDVAAPHTDQLDWEGDRVTHSLGIKQWMSTAGGTVRMGEPGDLMFDERIVRDWRGDLVRDFLDLPLVISSMLLSTMVPRALSLFAMQDVIRIFSVFEC